MLLQLWSLFWGHRWWGHSSWSRSWSRSHHDTGDPPKSCRSGLINAWRSCSSGSVFRATRAAGALTAMLALISSRLFNAGVV